MDAKLELVKQIKELALKLSKEYDVNIEIVLSTNPELDSVKCKVTEFNL